ncbi:MAG: PEP-CTERM sorting domain-containing protein [Paucibacter sp.]|nr:PEP-CTERM sorting domain-containing protein [Roseateles sp.]
MKFIKTAALGAALSLSALAAQAQTTFNFAYTFDPANAGTVTNNPTQVVTITGSFTGTEVGNLISNISNISVALNGTSFAGPLMVEAFDNTGNISDTVAPVVSTNVALSNFVFVDADVAAGGNPSNYFLIATLPDSNGVMAPEAFAVNTNTVDSNGNALSGDERAASNAHWTVTAVSAVPEPSTYVLMAAGLGLVGLRLQRRRQA